MATDVISSLAGSLDAELEKAKETLRGVDSSIKKVFGKDVSELQLFGRNRRGAMGGGRRVVDDRDKSRYRDEYVGVSQATGEPLEKKRKFEHREKGDLHSSNDHPRIRYRGDYEEDFNGRKKLASQVVSSGKEKSREDVLAQQQQDKESRNRNRRMFGALLGTLQRFKQDETRLKDKEEKRAQIEAKLDEAAKKERDEVRREKQQLIRDRKLKLTEIKRLEIKRRRVADLEQWEEKTKYLSNFIRTESKPYIFYLPKKLNPITECRLEQSKNYVTEMIANQRKLVLEDIENYEARSKRYWERKVSGHDVRRSHVHPIDEDIEEELKELMKNEDKLMEIESSIPEEAAEDLTVTVAVSDVKDEMKRKEDTQDVDKENSSDKVKASKLSRRNLVDSEVPIPYSDEENNDGKSEDQSD